MNKNNLLNKSVNGVLWTFLDVVINKAGFFIATIFIARMLGPEIYGLIGMITILITIGNSLVDSGMSVSLIRSPRIENIDVSSVFWGSFCVSLFVYVIFYLLAPQISVFYNQPILVGVIRIYCLIFIISAFRVVQSALLLRNLEFRKNTILMLPAVLISIVTGLTLAYYNYGIWSVVYMYLVQQLVLTFMLWFFSDTKFDFTFSFSVFKRHFSFGYKLTLSGLLNTACNNFNNIIIGKYYTVIQSGLYERSYSLNQYPVTVFTAIVSKVSMPVLARIQDDREKVSKILNYLLKYSFLIMSFVMVVMVIFAYDIIYLLLGEEWLEAKPFLQILSIGALFVPIHMFNVNILQVYGRSDLFLKAEVIKKILQVILIIVLFQFGIYWLVSSLVFLSFVELFINAYFVNKIIPLTIKQQLSSIAVSLIIFLALLCFYVFYVETIGGLEGINKIYFLVFIIFTYMLFAYVSYKKDFLSIKKILNK